VGSRTPTLPFWHRATGLPPYGCGDRALNPYVIDSMTFYILSYSYSPAVHRHHRRYFRESS
jgi:hypothetical protein